MTFFIVKESLRGTEDSSLLCYAKKSIGKPKPDRNSLLLTIDNFIKATKLKAIQ